MWIFAPPSENGVSGPNGYPSIQTLKWQEPATPRFDFLSFSPYVFALRVLLRLLYIFVLRTANVVILLV